MKHTLPCALDWRRWLALKSLVTVFATIASAQSSKPPVLISEKTPHVPSPFSQNTNATFIGTLRQYSISGHVQLGSSPYASQPVTLSGGQTTVINTDGNGDFVFNGLTAASSYVVSPDPTPLRSFPPQSVPYLSGNQFLNFADVPRKYSISGTIRDLNGKPVVGAFVNLSGTETGATRCNSDGRFTIQATVLGNYTISPDIEQQYYSFIPSNQTLNSLLGDQTRDFTATLSPLPNPSQVLEFDGTPKSVDYGNFWPGFTNLGHFFWEFWSMPGNNAGATYLLSDGYGGLHALLFGLLTSTQVRRIAISFSAI